MLRVNGRPAAILIVEDSPADQRAIRRAFERSKFSNSMYFVDDGQAAIEFLRHEGDFTNPDLAPRPDMILLDLNLPKLDGRQVLEIIKRDDALRSIPVIVLTTSSRDEDIARSYELGVNSFLTKPEKAGAFLEMMQAFENYWLQYVALPHKGDA